MFFQTLSDQSLFVGWSVLGLTLKGTYRRAVSREQGRINFPAPPISNANALEKLWEN